ncbi:MAG: adenylate/guanylate cyclase domain-containing protein [Ignavibacteria bacterium]|nr:adenylate/guanylate cyclase domain-containing protein [Ignavibacteria bacterium]
MNNIPSGIVTFLFTDIEGSTKLSQEFPETYTEALKKHNAILQNAVESNNGFVFKTVGDAFCCAFQNAEDAVKSAIDAQIKFRSEKRNELQIKVRIGIHSGKSEWSGTDYMGYLTLARSARVMSCAYGQQIIISDNTYQLLPKTFLQKGEISFRDLGERRLKDIIQPICLFQIVSSGLHEDFPPLKTLDARPNNLPVQLTSFIGREKSI